MKMTQNKLLLGLTALIILIFVGGSYMTAPQILIAIVIFAAIFGVVAAI